MPVLSLASRRRPTLPAASLLLGLALVGCGDNAPPPPDAGTSAADAATAATATTVAPVQGDPVAAPASVPQADRRP